MSSLHPPFISPPPRYECTVTDDSSGEAYLGWASAAARLGEPGSSPVCSLHILINQVKNMTKSSERLTGLAAMKLATGGAVPYHMDVEDAVTTLKFVVAKESKRAAKRKAAAEAAAAAELAEKQRVGAARAAKRAKVAARPVKTHRSVDNVGRVSMYYM